MTWYLFVYSLTVLIFCCNLLLQNLEDIIKITIIFHIAKNEIFLKYICRSWLQLEKNN